MQMRRLAMTLFCTLPMAALMYGCGSSSKEGSSSLADVATVGDTACIQCHSSVVDPLTGVGKVAQYEATSPHKDSPYANNGNGCEACHGNGGAHNGVGPIPYVNPYDGNGTRCADCHKGNYATNAPTKFADSKHANVVIEEGNSCRRCHTHEGAVLSNVSGFTGEKNVLDNATFQGAVPLSKEYTQFKCQTCHEHGGGLRAVTARDTYTVSGITSPGTGTNIINWNPSQSNLVNDQFNLCTSCHGLKTYDGKYVMASGTATSGQYVHATAGTAGVDPVAIGTAAVGHHEDTWYRVIATTHFNNLNNTKTDAAYARASSGISGYVIRTKGETPCFDCHAHEAKTNTNLNNPNSATYVPNGLSTTDTIYTDWASSGHAGNLLAEKYNTAGTAAKSTTLVDNVMKTVTTDPAFGGDGGHDWSATGQQSCQRCHTATGASNYLNAPATYDNTKNDFSHLFNAATGKAWSTTTKAATQQEMLYCWACHSNAGAGVIRNPGAQSFTYSNGATASYTDMSSSNVCIACHSGRETGASIDGLSDASMSNVGFVNSHYMAAAGLMYVKSGYTNFVPASTVIGTSTYGASLTSDADGGALTSTHRKLGTAAMATDSHTGGQGFITDGACVTCHMPLKNGQKSHSLAIDGNTFNAVCSKCHTSEGTTTLTAANFKTAFVEEQAVPFQNALTLAVTLLKNKYNIEYDSAAYPYFFKGGLAHTSANAQKDWTIGGTLSAANAKKLMGACFNINLLSREPAAYVHARTYARRLLYDSIDFLDDGIINLSVGATAVATTPSVYVKDTTAGGTTTASMQYLLSYDRTTLAWKSPERP